MRITLEGALELDGDRWPVDLSVPLSFGESSCTAFGLPEATCRQVFSINETGDRGCRCDEITFCAHTHTTHIESCSHVHHVGGSLTSSLVSLPPLLLALLIDVAPSSDLCNAVMQLRSPFPDISPEAVLLRTGAISRNVDGTKLGFYALDVETVTKLAEALPEVKVLLIDSVSVDPEDDGGLLLAHRAFFVGDPGRFIVELCYIPPDIESGLYALAINAASFNSDAVPCRPVLYHLKKKKID